MIEKIKNFFASLTTQNGAQISLWDWLIAPSPALKSMEERSAARLAASFLFAITLLDLVGGFARIPRWGFVTAFLIPALMYALCSLL